MSRKGPSEARLRVVAELYDEALDDDTSPLANVMGTLGLTRDQARDLVLVARRNGYLPPSVQGQKRGNVVTNCHACGAPKSRWRRTPYPSSA